MSKDNKHTQGSPGDFEDKIDSAMAGLEADLDEEFHGADFYDEDDQESDFDSWEGEDDSDAEELLSRILKRSIQRKKSTTRMRQS